MIKKFDPNKIQKITVDNIEFISESCVKHHHFVINNSPRITVNFYFKYSENDYLSFSIIMNDSNYFTIFNNQSDQDMTFDGTVYWKNPEDAAKVMSPFCKEWMQTLPREKLPRVIGTKFGL